MTINPSSTDQRTCRFPGCERPAVASEAGAGRPPEYCEEQGHNRAAAWRARRRLDENLTGRSDDDLDRPVDAARLRASAIRGQVTGMVELLGQQLQTLVEELRTIADPDAAEAQIDAVTTEAAEQVAAAAARASRAEQAQRRAEEQQLEADAAAAEASELAETLQASLEGAREQLADLGQSRDELVSELSDVRTAAETAERNAQADLARLREEIAAARAQTKDAERDRDRATSRAEAATTARAEAEERARIAVSRAETETTRAQHAEAETVTVREQLELVRAELDEARSRTTELLTRVAGVTSERDSARADVEREKAHGDQRVNDLRTVHDQQVSQLREELVEVRQEARDQRSRADRAEAQLIPEPTGTDPTAAVKRTSRRRGKTDTEGQS